MYSVSLMQVMEVMDAVLTSKCAGVLLLMLPPKVSHLEIVYPAQVMEGVDAVLAGISVEAEVSPQQLLQAMASMLSATDLSLRGDSGVEPIPWADVLAGPLEMASNFIDVPHGEGARYILITELGMIRRAWELVMVLTPPALIILWSRSWPQTPLTYSMVSELDLCLLRCLQLCLVSGVELGMCWLTCSWPCQ